MSFFDPKSFEEEKQGHREVVRLKTTWWHDGRGMHMRKSLLFLRRKSHGHQLIEEDCSMIGADEVFPRITNIAQCEDGIYVVVTCNESRDYETGIIDDYDYKLVAYADSASPVMTNVAHACDSQEARRFKEGIA